MRTMVENEQFDEERALYNLQEADVKNCVFAGPADGESVLKESRDVHLTDCTFSLRYPLWHVKKFTMELMEKKKRETGTTILTSNR